MTVGEKGDQQPEARKQEGKGGGAPVLLEPGENVVNVLLGRRNDVGDLLNAEVLAVGGRAGVGDGHEDVVKEVHVHLLERQLEPDGVFVEDAAALHPVGVDTVASELAGRGGGHAQAHHQQNG